MADNTPLFDVPSGAQGDIISTDDLGTVKVQRVKVQYGEDGSAEDVSLTNPLPISDAGGSLTVDGTVAISGTVPVSDGGGSLTVDGTFWPATQPVSGTVAISGTVPVSGTFFQTTQPVSIASTVTVDSELPAAAALSDTLANPTTPFVGAAVMGYNGTTWSRIHGTTANGLQCDITRLPTVTATIAALTDRSQRTNLTDGTNDVSVKAASTAVAGTDKALVVAVRDAVPVTDNGGSLTVDGTFWQTTQPVSLASSVAVTGTFFQATQPVSQSGTWTVQPGNTANTTPWLVNAASTGNVAHDAADSGNPVKVGAYAANAFPTAVSNADRANLISDLFGRLLVSHIDPAQQVTKPGSYTTQQTGTAIWTPTSGKRVVVTSVTISAGGTTSGKVVLWFGNTTTPDTTYDEGTDQALEKAFFAPSANANPGLAKSYPIPIACQNASYALRITTSAAMTVEVTVHGYEA